MSHLDVGRVLEKRSVGILVEHNFLHITDSETVHAYVEGEHHASASSGPKVTGYMAR